MTPFASEKQLCRLWAWPREAWILLSHMHGDHTMVGKVRIHWASKSAPCGWNGKRQTGSNPGRVVCGDQETQPLKGIDFPKLETQNLLLNLSEPTSSGVLWALRVPERCSTSTLGRWPCRVWLHPKGSVGRNTNSRKARKTHQRDRRDESAEGSKSRKPVGRGGSSVCVIQQLENVHGGRGGRGSCHFLFIHHLSLEHLRAHERP